jgi:hypothetical protein
MKEPDEVFAKLAQSRFRSRMRLGPTDADYFSRKKMQTLREHAAEFIATRLAQAHPLNDGKQTLWRGHPVFVAQHATATCCRSCLEKWHAIEKGRELSEQEREYVVNVITRWLDRQVPSDLAQRSQRNIKELFDLNPS